MADIIAHNVAYQLHPDRYWHVAPRRGSMLLHNAHLGEGIIFSISALRRGGIGLEQSVTPYGALNRHQDKETVWEQVRTEHFGSLPTRQHALFLFDDEGQATKSYETWFRGEDRVVIEARIVRGTTFHRADAAWLEGTPEKWPENAANYWRGTMTANPRPEIVVEGPVYFPGWREKPFGFFAGLLPDKA